MLHSRSLLLPALLAAPLLGQKADLTVPKDQDQVLRYSIQTKLKTETTRKVLIDGEEPEAGAFGGGGRGFGGGGPAELEQKVVFDQGAGWRHYHTLDALEIRQGRDGEPVETEVKGALAGKKVRVTRNEEGATVLVEGEGEAKKELPAQLGRGVAHRTDLRGLLPGKEVAVGEAWEIGKTFRAALAGVVHPVVPESAAGPRGEGRGNRGGGGEGQGGGERAPRGEGRPEGGGGGPGRGFGGRGGAGSAVLDLVQSEKLDCEAKGKLLAIDGSVARIEIQAVISGKGDAEALGLRSAGGFGRFGGRRGGGEEGQQPQAKTSADVKLEIAGVALVDLTSHLVTGLELEGKLTQSTESKRTLDFQGEERQMETTGTTSGTVRWNVKCEAAPGS